jgi:hypothetical protein
VQLATFKNLTSKKTPPVGQVERVTRIASMPVPYTAGPETRWHCRFCRKVSGKIAYAVIASPPSETGAVRRYLGVLTMTR